MARTKVQTLGRLGGSKLRKLVTLLLVVAAVVWLVVQDPTGAAHFVSTVVHGIATFVRALS